MGKQQRLNSILGLSLDGNQLEGVVLRRTNGSAEISASFSVSLACNPLSSDVELAAKEIRNHLDAAEIRERNCAVSLPLNWALTLQVKLPDLPEEDLQSFLALEAERGFPMSPEALLISSSRSQLPNGERWVTLVALPREQVVRLESVLRAARLIPLSMSLGISALQPPSGEGVMALQLCGGNLGLSVTGCRGLLALRTLDAAIESDGAATTIRTDMIARELRITLGQLSNQVRGTIQSIVVLGAAPLADRAAEELRPRAQTLGLRLERQVGFKPGFFALKLPPAAVANSATALAARVLGAQPLELEFLPPRVSAWQQFSTKYSSRKLAYVGMALGVVALCVLTFFLFQQWELSKLRGRWATLGPRVRELEDIQQQIKLFRPWFDPSLHNLTVLKQVTEVFPEDGAVTAKMIEIRDAAPVSCSGTAKNNEALNRMLQTLRGVKGVSDVQVGQVVGTAPVQFTFNFQWGGHTQP